MSKGKDSSLTSIAFNTGVTLERERIIKLLDTCPKSEAWHLENPMCCEGRCDFTLADYQKRLIALIKGENK